MDNTLPEYMLELAVKVPFLRTKKLEKNLKDFKMLNSKLTELYAMFEFFITKRWIYVNERIYTVIDKLDPEERKSFACDVKEIDWLEWLRNYLCGLNTWVFKLDHIKDF